MSEHKIPIPSMLYNAAVGGHVTNSQQIIDENLNREQNDINQETVGAIPYNSTIPNGMGRIVLKKNDNFKQVIESQINGNTIFVIKYDFTLTSNVTIPANCVLEFDGGSIRGNGTDKDTVTGNNTEIKSGLGRIFNSIKLSGSYINKELSISCWGVKEGTEQLIISENSSILSDYVIPSFENINCTLIIPKGTFCYSTPIVLSGNFDVNCIGTLSYYGNVESTALTIGVAGSYTSYKNFNLKLTYGNNIRNYYVQTESGYSVPENYGLKIINAYTCIINIDFVSGFANNVIFVGDSDGFVYNTINIRCISGYSNKYLILKAINEGWVNENLFIGGQFQTFSSNPVNGQNIAISLDGKSSSHLINNNVFIKPSVENIYVGIKFNYARDNSFYNIRNESVTKTVVTEDNADRNNLVIYSGNTSATGTDFAKIRGSVFQVGSFDNLNKVLLAEGPIVKLKGPNNKVSSNFYLSRYNLNPDIETTDGLIYYGMIVDTRICNKYFLCNDLDSARFFVGILDDNFEKIDVSAGPNEFMYNTEYMPNNNWLRTGSNGTNTTIQFKPRVKYAFIGTSNTANYLSIYKYTYNNPIVELPNKPLNIISFIPNSNSENMKIGHKVFVAGTLNKFIWWNGTAWVDAIGTPV